jgi:hypothetical protein
MLATIPYAPTKEMEHFGEVPMKVCINQQLQAARSLVASYSIADSISFSDTP